MVFLNERFIKLARLPMTSRPKRTSRLESLREWFFATAAHEASTPGFVSADMSLLGRLRGPVRLRTLTTLRWLAVVGQTLTILFVHFGLGFQVPLGICLGTIAASAWLNLFTVLRFSPQRFLSDAEATLYIAFDIVQLCALLAFTGGLQNPFAALILAPVTIAASVLPLRSTLLIGGLALMGMAVLTIAHMPLPWQQGDMFAMPGIYIIGVWAALSFSVVFFAAYAHRIAAEAAQMRSALTATQMVLSREERLSALGGLAAAAAHELGTPLATIQLTAGEMAEEVATEGPLDRAFLKDDAELLVSQARRCRDILMRLSARGDEGDAMHNQVRLDTLVKEAANPFLDQPEGPEIIFEVGYDPMMTAPPTLPRKPEMIYGLRNFIENAVRYAHSAVKISARWEDDQVSVTVTDDGPGFSPEMLGRLGEPYVNPKSPSQRTKKQKKQTADPTGYEGMGLGFFIAKTLLERTKASIYFDNLQQEGSARPNGAFVSAVWPLTALAHPNEEDFPSREG